MTILNMVSYSSGGSNIGEPTNLSVAISGTTATIKWTDNDLNAIPPSTFQKSVLVRKVGSAPTSPSDGTLVVTETTKNTYSSSGYADTGLTSGTTYYYRVYSYSSTGGITYGSAVSATTGWGPGANTIAYYPFDDQSSTQITDATGNGYNLTGGTMPSYSLVSGTNYAGNYNNYNSGNVQGHSFYSSLSSYTLLCWAKPINGSGNQFVTQLYDSGSYQAAIIYGYVSGKFELFAVSGSSQRIDIATNVSTNTWYLLGYTKSGTTVTVYCNGTAGTSITYNSTPKNYLYLGGSNGGDRFHGMLDNVIIEGKARTAQEISDYYNQTKSNYGL